MDKIMRNYSDIEQMADQDYNIGLTAHYIPLAQLVIGYKTMIEVGTAYGGNAFHLLSNTKLETLVCVDPYTYYPAMPGFTCQEEYDTLFEYAKNRLIDFDRVMFVRATSKESFEAFSKVDIVFLDGSHDYEDVKWECENYSTIIKPGGVLSGHDYNIFEGVNKAVDEFAASIGKPVYFLPGNIWFINY
jgi:Methyltransferase domain